MQQFSSYDFENLHIVLGFVKGKEDSNLWEILPKNAIYYFCCANIPRALPTDILVKKAMQYNLHFKVFISVKKAFEAAKKYAKPNDMIYIGGSIYVVAEII